MTNDTGHLVLIETAANQAFIFGSNRLREQVGASQLIHDVSRWVLEAVLGPEPKEGIPPALTADARLDPLERLDPLKRLEALRTLADDWKIERDCVEVLVAASGKAVLLAPTREAGAEIIAAVTKRALDEAPGLTVRGFIGDAFSLSAASAAPDDTSANNARSVAGSAVEKVHAGIERLRLSTPPSETRFPTLPFLEPCVSTGRPANIMHINRGPGRTEPVPVSLATQAKLDAFANGCKRIAASADPEDRSSFASSITALENDETTGSMLGVIHADGNGFGQIFLEFDAVLRKAGDHPEVRYDGSTRRYLDLYRAFSLALDSCGIKAFRAALGTLEASLSGGGGKNRFPVLPVVLGGDDLTVICDGTIAIDLAAEYLKAFEQTTANDPLIAALTDAQGLGAAAGVALIKPHHPFYRAHGLADELAKSAKATKRRLGTSAVSAFDYQIVLDGAPTTLADMRHAWMISEAISATARPYVVSDDERVEQTAGSAQSEAAATWWRSRRFADLKCAAQALGPSRPDEFDRAGDGLPRTQQHMLREALFLGPDVADARLEAIRARYRVHWDAIAPGGSLFAPSRNGKGKHLSAARLLDALEFAEVRGSRSAESTEAPA